MLNNNYFSNNEKSLCCGCGGCAQICPVDAISMQEDENGYLYPVKDDEKCIDCKLCEKRCPVANGTEGACQSISAYMAINNNDEQREKSASGGAFVAIAENFARKNNKYAIFGAQFDDELKVCHTYINDIKYISKYQKSKYIQSEIGDTYKKCKEHLEKGYSVLFSGTPCQIQGLKTYVNKEYENLFTVDLICHGVPGQKIFDEYIKYIETKYDDKVEGYTFRHKIKNIWGDTHSRNCHIKMNKKNVVISAERDIYLRGYHSGLFYRESCYHCKYACPERTSDITLGDYWYIERIYPQYDAIEGVSGILVNTPKGRKLLEGVETELLLKETTVKQYVDSNSQLRKPSKLNPNRGKFLTSWKTDGIEKAVRENTSEANIIKLTIRKVFPKKLRKILKKMLGKK